jgi:hypothetical protein
MLTVALLAASAVANATVLLTENFDDVSTLSGSGWSQVNNSTPIGSTGWFQGNTGVFDAQNGAADSYIAANYLNAGDGGDVSNWLISPEFTLRDGADLTFFTRSSGFLADRLEVRISTNGASTNVGSGVGSVGDFTTLLATINPSLGDGYPTDWTAFSLSFAGITDGLQGRFAFRYFVTDTFQNGDYVGIDNVKVSVPEPSTLALLTLGLFALGFSASKRGRGRA